MYTILQSVLVGATALATTAAVADATFYAAENFSGQPFGTPGAVPNFVAKGFNDRARSAVVEAPAEVCVDINYGGGTVLNPGRYPTLGNLGNHISSVGPVAGATPRAVTRTGPTGKIASRGCDTACGGFIASAGCDRLAHHREFSPTQLNR